MAVVGILTMLDEKQLPTLAQLIYRQEVNEIMNIKFESEPARAKYLRDCLANKESFDEILKSAHDAKRKFEKDDVKASIAEDIFNYMVSSLNLAYQTIRNYIVRKDYLTKISTHAKDIIKALDSLDSGNIIEVKALAEEASNYRNTMLDIARKYLSPASRAFSTYLKDTGLKFDELVRRYQAKRGFPGSFEDLDDEQKFLVYSDIIEASGRGNVPVTEFSKAFGLAGFGLLLLTVGMMVWDIFTSAHVIKTATRDAVVTAASEGGAMLAEITTAAIKTGLEIDAEAASLFVAVSGIVTGIIGAFILGILTMLDEKQLPTLAQLIYRQEVNEIMYIKFESEPARAKYLRDCLANKDSFDEILKSAHDTKRKFEKDGVKASIAEDIFNYMVSCLNLAYQTIRNYTLRKNYLTKISTHAKDIIKALESLDSGNIIEVKALAEEAANYRNVMLDYARKYQSTASRAFSRYLKDTGLKFDELVRRYQAKRGYPGSFEDLDDEQKFLVYNDIIEASGRGNVPVTKFSKAFGLAGFSLLLLTVGMMVWDIFTSAHPIKTTTRDAVVTAASEGGAELAEITTAAIETELEIDAEAASLFVPVLGVVIGIVGAFILGTLAGELIDLIFGSGASAPLSTDGHICYVAPMPDGVVLARQIAHNS